MMTVAMVRTFEPTLTAVRSARQFVGDGVPAPLLDDATLAVSELASNAVLHARTRFTVRVLTSPAAVRIEVSDESSEMPVVQEPSVDSIGGRGLVVVETLADTWGTESSVRGKTVWFELAV
jgi:anti-sigma regulatory factor (Ser/Thr protein kinase)